MTPASLPELLVALPALAVVMAALVIVLVEALWRRTNARLIDGIALVGLGGAAFLETLSLRSGGDGSAIYRGAASAVSGPATALVRQDALAAFGGLLILVAAAFTVLVGGAYVARRGLRQAEYTAVVLFAAAGMLLLGAAADLIMIFLGVEAFSIALYVLCAFRSGDRAGYEAALKYFVLGSLAAGFLLYGTALVYGATGSTELARIGQVLADPDGGGSAGQLSVGLAGLTLLLVGLGFKMALVPFHQWAPDVYQGAPTPITGFMAAATKTAATVALIRVLWTAFGGLSATWLPAVAALAVVTMVVGNLAAIVQADVKRMLAFSAIAQAGYVLVALVAATTGGVAAALYYLLAYGLAKLGAFGVLALLDGQGSGGADDDPGRGGPAADRPAPGPRDATTLADLAGLGRTQPWLAATMTICLMSLVGLPPMAGFLGKWMIFQSAVDGGWTWLAVVLVLNTALSAFYYLRPIGWMYMVEPKGNTVSDGDTVPEVGSGASFALTVAVLGLVAALVSGGIVRVARAADAFDQRRPDAPAGLPPELGTATPSVTSTPAGTAP
ncbi:MAG: NADH-quinone oxidoreductase subunit N [Ardenticatenales bacterium]|nr:NADH-quinone oxidoreductase subunit N [Ardenticatenales bacterium]